MLVLRNEDTFDEVATLGESFRPALGVAGEEVADDKASPEELLFLQFYHIFIVTNACFQFILILHAKAFAS